MAKEQRKDKKEFRCPECNANTVIADDGTVKCVACPWVKKPDE